MNIREKLVELLDDIQVRGEDFTDYEIYGMRLPDTVSNEDVASHLIASGVTVQKHGRWLLDGRCSECLENPLTTHKTYCPSCGAKMDLER